MSDIILPEESDFAATEKHPADEAFEKAKAGFELFGKELSPYTPSRKVAAQSMGMLYPYVGEQGAERMRTFGIYPGALNDTIILLWLCSLKDASDQTKEDVKAGTFNPQRALRRPNDALDAAMAWAEEMEILNVDSSRFTEAFGIFMAIASGVEASEFYLKDEETNLLPEGGEAPKI